MSTFTIEIDVYSDPVCPWCYLGKAALDRAITSYLTRHPDAEFKLAWKPYLLWPNARRSAYDKIAALRAVYGVDTPAAIERLAQLGAQYDIDFMWEGKTGNSRDAQKLILLAMEHDAARASAPEPSSPLPTFPSQPATNPPYTQTLQNRTQSHLYVSAFQQGADISSPAFLAGAAVTLGLFPTEEEALARLHLTRQHSNNNNDDGADNDDNANHDRNSKYDDDDDDELGKRVDSSSARARQIGVTAVPSYVVQGRWQVGGMQGEDLWMGIFERARAAMGHGGEGGR